MYNRGPWSGRCPGPCLNIKTVFPRYGDSHVKDKAVARPSCLVYKRQVSEIDLSQFRHETAFSWCHNGPVASQLSDRIKWPKHAVELIGIYVHINTHNKESLTQRFRRSTNIYIDMFNTGDFISAEKTPALEILCSMDENNRLKGTEDAFINFWLSLFCSFIISYCAHKGIKIWSHGQSSCLSNHIVLYGLVFIFAIFNETKTNNKKTLPMSVR